MRKLRRYNLQFNQTEKYLQCLIREIASIYSDILGYNSWEKGDFFTELPRNAYLDRIYDFEWSGIIPADEILEEKQVLQNGDVYIPKCIYTTKGELKKFMMNFLNLGRSHKCYIYDWEKKHRSVCTCAKDLRSNEFNMKTSDLLIFLHTKSIADEYNKNIMTGFDMCIFPAYDGEAWIFWKNHILENLKI